MQMGQNERKDENIWGDGFCSLSKPIEGKNPPRSFDAQGEEWDVCARK